jgi:4-amino-4-deoxy-L-arabinose transferase-like glycosyltransferase
MTNENWVSKTYDHADAYIAGHEEETKTRAVIDCGKGIHVLLPKGLPALKIRFHGLFMIAPLPLLMVCVVFLPLSGFLGEWEVNTTTLGISLLCLLMFAGLMRVILVMLNHRDMFPRKYFVTLGPNGLAMHFSRIHFPTVNPKAFIAWKDVESAQRGSTFFLPALLLGRPTVPALQVVSRNGPVVSIPMLLPPSTLEEEFTQTETLIQQHLQG